ncbi:hypothetical protein CSV63_07355 [Sporosarcina sp. P34]|uniref:hypothetical protein n=1 Tax=Sporosarcina sp. P34 TaxID=2048247 RepID=UPI000C16F2BC|nr:hypothetical protein [Sporosarcina sp. P34]PID15588.1 hypothetical protein CSV63_07355 [Sporosarcina sp. P34]
MTNTLKILSLIWKSGAEIYRDEKDGRLALNNASLIHPEVLKSAEPIFNQIDDWFKSWEGATGPDITIRKALELYCGWTKNEKMNTWLLSDNESLNLLHDWTVVLARNGWRDPYDDYRQYENDESNEMKTEFYKRAVSWASRNK